MSLWRSCAAQGGPEGRVCGHGEGVSRRRKTHAARVPLRPWKPPRPPGHERGATHCVCVCATQPGALLRGVQLVRQGLGAGCGREGSPHATRRGRRWTTASSCACVRRAGGVSAPWSQRDARRSATASLRTGGYQRIKKSSNWSSKAGRPGGEPEACVSTGGPEPLVRRVCPAPYAPGQNEEEERRPPEGHRQPGRRTGCTPENPRSSKRHAAPRARAGGHAARSSDCGCPAGSG